MSDISVLIATHNPHPGRLARVLASLEAQSLPRERFEVLLIDNASDRVDLRSLPSRHSLPLQRLEEPQLGLSHARRCGMRAARSELLVLVDDDNVLAADFLERALALAAAHPGVGSFGGRVVAEFEHPPLAWHHEFFSLLALVDHGPDERIFSADEFRKHPSYPAIAPVGAGMLLRRGAATAWLDRDAARPDSQRLSDRRGNSSASSGDNDIVLCALESGWDTAYFPQLQLTHLIPTSRLHTAALGRLNRGIQRSWQQLLRLHRISPWSALSAPGARLRCWRAWWTFRTWRSDAHWVRWQGACGHFEGRVAAERQA